MYRNLKVAVVGRQGSSHYLEKVAEGSLIKCIGISMFVVGAKHLLISDLNVILYPGQQMLRLRPYV
ncbi:MAG: hypothetical protein DYG84_06830 [Candidatus Brocadia sp. AMX3]|nr:hypothetical protein [Candidatus Brocadia sp. AMX3]